MFESWDWNYLLRAALKRRSLYTKKELIYFKVVYIEFL